jgi:hypothetical protein
MEVPMTGRAYSDVGGEFFENVLKGRRQGPHTSGNRECESGRVPGSGVRVLAEDDDSDVFRGGIEGSKHPFGTGENGFRRRPDSEGFADAVDVVKGLVTEQPCPPIGNGGGKVLAPGRWLAHYR